MAPPAQAKLDQRAVKKACVPVQSYLEDGWPEDEVPEEGLRMILHTHKCPWFAITHFCRTGQLNTKASFGLMSSDEATARTYITAQLQPWFDSTDDADKFLLGGAVGKVRGAYLSCRNRAKISDELEEKAIRTSGGIDDVPLTMQASTKTAAENKLRSEHPDLRLTDKHFPHPCLWDILHTMMIRCNILFMSLALLRTMEEDVRVSSRSFVDESGFRKWMLGLIKPIKSPTVEEAFRRVTSFFYLKHMIGLYNYEYKDGAGKLTSGGSFYITK